MMSERILSVVAVLLAISLPASAVAEEVGVPFGTRVFIELDQQVTSKRKDNSQGSLVRAHVWKDVVVNDRTVVRAGAPAMVQVGEIKPAKVAGVKGHVELKAQYVTGVDGSDVMLTGGYDQSGKSRVALSVTLAAVVFLPLIFLKGKQAELPPGTIFDAMVANPTTIEVEGSQPRKIKIAASEVLQVEVRYDVVESAGDEKVKNLPLRIRAEGAGIVDPRVISVNETKIDPIPIQLDEVTPDGEGHVAANASVDLSELGKHFTRGFNRFTVEAGNATAEVMLDLEL